MGTREPVGPAPRATARLGLAYLLVAGLLVGGAGGAAAGAPTVSGTVSDGSGGLPGIEVAAFDGTTGVPGPTAVTDADGTYSLVTDEGAHLLRFSDPGGRFATVFHGGAPTADAAAPVVVPGGAGVVVDATMSLAVATLWGDVTDAVTGQSLGGIAVDVIEEATGRLVASAATSEVADPSVPTSPGHFELEVPAGDHLVRFTDPDGLYARQFHTGAASAGDARPPLAVAAGAAVEASVGLRRDRATVQGRVRAEITGPVGGVTVTAIDHTTGAVVAQTTTADEDDPVSPGHYTFEVPPGDYLIHFDDPDPTGIHLDAFHPDRRSAEQALVVTAVTGAVHTADGTLVRDRGHIHGEVVDADGLTRISGAEVTVIDVATGAVLATATTTEPGGPGPGGEFEAEVPSGEYLVRVSDPTGAYAPEFHGGASFADEAVPVLVRPGHNERLVFALDPAVAALDSGTARLTGQVRGLADPGDSQLEGAAIEVYDLATGTVAATATTDAMGDFDVHVPVDILPGQSTGRFAVHVADPSGVHLSQWVASPPPGTMTSLVWHLGVGGHADVAADLLPAWATVRGQVNSGASGPLPGAAVAVFDLATGREITEATTDTDTAGAFDTTVPVDAHAGGEHRRVTLRVAAEGHVPVWYGASDQTMSDGQILELVAMATHTDLDAWLLPAVATIGGEMRDPASDPVGGILVEAFDLSTGDPVAHTRSNASDGTFLLEVPAPTLPGQFPSARYAMRGSDPAGLFRDTWVESGTGLTSASSYELHAGSSTTHHTGWLQPATGEVAGTVSADLGGALLAEAEVVFHDVTTGEVAGTTTTDVDGRYATILPEGSYLARATATDHAGEWHEDAPDLFGAAPVMVSWDTPASGVDFALPPLNAPPTADAGGDTSGTEGSPVVLAATVDDPDGDVLAIGWTVATGAGVDAGATCTFSAPAAVDTELTCEDDGTFTATLTVSDGVNNPVTDDVEVVLANVEPVLGQIAVSTSDPVSVGAEVSLDAPFFDAGGDDTHTWSVDWGDGTITAGSGDPPVEAAHVYDAPGVYTVAVSVTDDDGGAGHGAHEYVVVYDPDGPFVTGGGWIDSPAGAWTADPSASGRATFGFVSRYRKGASTPDGSTEFRFQSGGLDFASTSYDWLVVAGDAARFKGEGELAGVGPVRFMLWATDGALKDPAGPDTFRIRLWRETDGVETTLYDNGADLALGGGSIVVHGKGK